MENILCIEAGQRIKGIRKLKKMTRESLAGKAGISSKFLYEIEQGQKKFSAEALCRIASALGVSCDYIMTGKIVLCEYEEGLAEVIALFDSEQQRKLIPILVQLHEFIN
ncbi:MAG: helix-turn-helix transcriptional regulator [Lachnospiraceae bacterium]|nr:helix-turn-helix transcriptional regulator [Lachnospiraceae bacterium]